MKDTTKFVERYDSWVCEKCGREFRDIPWEGCPGCTSEVVELVTLDHDVGIIW